MQFCPNSQECKSHSYLKCIRIPIFNEISLPKPAWLRRRVFSARLLMAEGRALRAGQGGEPGQEFPVSGDSASGRPGMGENMNLVGARAWQKACTC